MAGATRSTDLFPVPPDSPGVGYSPYQETCATVDEEDPCADGFFTWLDASSLGAASHRYSTYLGGSAGIDRVTAIAAVTTTITDPNAPATSASYRLYLAGATESPSFPFTPGPSGPSAFVTTFDMLGPQLIYSTAVGGSGIETPSSVAVFPGGEVAIAGGTDSTDFPLTDPLFAQATSSGTCPPSGCAFVTVLSPAGDAVLFSTYLDDSGLTSDPRITSDPVGNLFVAATTSDAGLATPDAFQPTPSGGADALVLKIEEAVAPAPNQPPLLFPLAPYVANATSPAGATIAVTAIVTDPELDPMTVTFAGPFNSVTSSAFGGGFLGAQLPFPIGTSTLAVTADDGRGNVTSATTTVTVLGRVVDTTGTVEVTPEATFNLAVVYWSRLHPQFEPTVRVKFENVTAPGVVTLNIQSNVAVPPVPQGHQLGSPPFYYDIASTVGASGPTTVCIDTTGMSFAADPSGVRLFRWTGAEWTDITTTPQGSFICGVSTGVGTFALFHPANPANAATTIAGSGFTPGQIDGPGGDPRDDLIDGGQTLASSLSLGAGGLAFDAVRNLLYTTTFASIRRIDLNTGVMETFGGDGVLGQFVNDPVDGAFGILPADNVDARQTHITNPNQLQLDAAGNLYIAEYLPGAADRSRDQHHHHGCGRRVLPASRRRRTRHRGEPELELRDGHRP